jgi:hypothetical protein
MFNRQKTFYNINASGLYYKHVTIVNDASSGVNKLKASLNDIARGVIYECHMFIVQATGVNVINFYRQLHAGQVS